MRSILQVSSAFLAALVLAPALAHALELPGKLRLPAEGYRTVQTIYYPGFYIAGFSEPLALASTLLLAIATGSGRAGFWLALVALACFIGIQAIYWIVIHPINKRWLEGAELKNAGETFFALGGQRSWSWTELRNRWEFALTARATLALVAFATLLLGMKIAS